MVGGDGVYKLNKQVYVPLLIPPLLLGHVLGWDR